MGRRSMGTPCGRGSCEPKCRSGTCPTVSRTQMDRHSEGEYRSAEDAPPSFLINWRTNRVSPRAPLLLEIVYTREIQENCNIVYFPFNIAHSRTCFARALPNDRYPALLRDALAIDRTASGGARTGSLRSAEPAQRVLHRLR